MLAAIVDGFGDALSGVKCMPYEGQFTERDIARVVNDAPAVYVSCVGVTSTDDQGDDMVGSAQWVASIVTKRAANVQSKASRFGAAIAIAEAVLPIIRDSNAEGGAWANESAGSPTRIAARNLFSPELDARALTLWVVTWEQPVSLVAFDSDALDDFTRAETEFDIGGDDPTAITTTLPGAA